jgi:4-amino-4-deoxy-L-arabinose transferase-like glycosyltransferase
MASQSTQGWRTWRLALLLVYLAAFAVLRLLLSKYIEYDDAEQLLFAQSLSLGYSAQPPLYTWMLWILIQAFGANVLSVTLLKVGLLAGLYLLLHRVARRFLSDERLVALASLSPLLMPLFVWEVPRLTHTLLLCNACLATLLLFLRLQEKRRTIDFVLLGVVVGVGLLSKYNFVIFVGSLFAAALSLKPFRTWLWDRRLALATLLATLVLLPHAVWLWEHLGQAYSRFDERNGDSGDIPVPGLLGLGSLLANLAIGAAALLLVHFLLYRRRQRIDVSNTSSSEAKLLNRLLLGMILLWIVLILAAGVRQLHLPWLAPILLLLPIWFIGRLGPSVLEVRHRIHAGLITAAAVVTLATQLVQIGLGYEGGKYQTRDFLFDKQATLVRADGFRSGLVIVMDPVLGGYQRLYFPSARVRCLLYPSNSDAKATRQTPILVVWDATERNGIPGEVRLHLRDHCGVRLPRNPPAQFVEVPPRPIDSSTRRLAYLLLPQTLARAGQPLH